MNDAFGTAHRAHASTVGVPELVKEKAAGLLMKEELENLDKAFSNPATPVVAIFGGAKVSDKLEVLRHILQRMDCCPDWWRHGQYISEEPGVLIRARLRSRKTCSARLLRFWSQPEKGRARLFCLPMSSSLEKMESGADTAVVAASRHSRGRNGLGHRTRDSGSICRGSA